MINNEGKKVGVLYHFTTLTALENLVNKKQQQEYALDIFEFFSMNNNFSCTRDGCLAQNILSRDISIKRGFNVRIDLDGDSISDKYKVRPLNGMIDNAPVDGKGERVGKTYQEREEIVVMKDNLKAKSKTFKALKYIKQIVFQNDIKTDSRLDSILVTLNILKIPYKFVRKYNKYLTEGIQTQSFHSHDLELVEK